MAFRTFTDMAGVEWQVWDVTAPPGAVSCMGTDL